MEERPVNTNLLWEIVQQETSPKKIQDAASSLIEWYCNREDFHNAAEATMVAAERMDSMDSRISVDEWWGGFCQNWWWEFLLKQEFFRKWVENREASSERYRWSSRNGDRRECSSESSEHFKMDHRDTASRSIPVTWQNDEDIIIACGEVFAELNKWIENHQKWSLGGLNALISMNMSRQDTQEQRLWNPATFGLRFIEPGNDDNRTSILNNIAKGQIRVVSVRLGSSDPGQGEPDVLD